MLKLSKLFRLHTVDPYVNIIVNLRRSLVKISSRYFKNSWNRFTHTSRGLKGKNLLPTSLNVIPMMSVDFLWRQALPWLLYKFLEDVTLVCQQSTIYFNSSNFIQAKSVVLEEVLLSLLIRNLIAYIPSCNSSLLPAIHSCCKYLSLFPYRKSRVRSSSWTKQQNHPDIRSLPFSSCIYFLRVT